MELSVYPAGEPLPAAVRRAVRLLFKSAYHSYHYLDEVVNSDRVRFVGCREGSVVAFASLKERNAIAKLANLLVRADFRGQGLGRALEEARYGWAKAKRLDALVSCTCENAASQTLKLDLGLQPVCVKFGYRRDVVSRHAWGSAVVFTDARIEIGTHSGSTVTVDNRLRRVRLVEPDVSMMLSAEGYGDSYVDIAVESESAALLSDDPRLRYAGVDYDEDLELWLHTFQLRNEAYRHGRDAAPVIARWPTRTTLPLIKEVEE
jgi:GNAT superfamily N-acetyltransferase